MGLKEEFLTQAVHSLIILLFLARLKKEKTEGQ